jgi:hypothetical protein
MPSETEYERLIKDLNSHAAILELLDRSSIANGAVGWSLGRAFEYGILRAFELEGAEVRYPFHVVGRGGGMDGRPGIIEQVDGVVYWKNLCVLVESKDYDHNVDIEPIAKLRFRLERRPPGTIGLIFTRREITEPASYLIRNTHPKNILVWQGDEIDLGLRQARMCDGLIRKYYHAVEYGLPDYNLKAE